MPEAGRARLEAERVDELRIGVARARARAREDLARVLPASHREEVGALHEPMVLAIELGKSETQAVDGDPSEEEPAREEDLVQRNVCVADRGSPGRKRHAEGRELAIDSGHTRGVGEQLGGRRAETRGETELHARSCYFYGRPMRVLPFAPALFVAACTLTTDLSDLATGSAADKVDGGDAAAAITDAGTDGEAEASVDTDACAPAVDGGPCGFQLILGLDIPVKVAWFTDSDIAYAPDLRASTGAFTRVAYRLILDDTSVWVELDPFTKEASKLGVPVDWVFAQPITNVNVISGSPALASIPEPRSGRVEFYSYCYGPGNDGAYNDNDEPTTDDDCYGSMQVHVDGRTVFAINKWSGYDNAFVGIGIGPQPVSSPDWTFADNAGSFTRRRLEVYIRP